MNIERMLFFTYSRFPDRSANSIQVMESAKAFAGYVDNLCLVGKKPLEDSSSQNEVFDFYGIDRVFTLIREDVPEHPGGKVQYFMRCASTIQNYRPDLVYSRTLTPLALATLQGYETIYEAHNPPVNLYQQGVFRLLRTLPNYLGTVFITTPLREQFNHFVDMSSKIEHVAPDGVDPKKFRMTEHKPSNPERFSSEVSTHSVALYTGSLKPGRGVFEVILPLARKCREWEFWVVGGEAKERRRLESEARSRSLETLRVIDFQPHRCIPWIMSQADALLMPYQRTVSVGSDHGFTAEDYMSPLKMFEYMAAGKAILASDLPAVREVLTDGETALLLDPEEPAAWERALRFVSVEEELVDRISEQSKAEVKNYSWTKRSKDILEAFSCGWN